MIEEGFKLNHSYDFKNKVWYEPDHSKPLIHIGSTNGLIDWKKVIESIENKPGKILPRVDWNNKLITGLYNLFEKSKYIPSSAEWINYYPDVDYDSEIDNIFLKIIDKPKIVRSWISRINPGKTAPWHYDVDDNEEFYLANGEYIRYTCRISEFENAHFTMVGNNSLYNTPTGDIYQWPDHRMWHGGANAGFKPKYQYNFIAYV